MANMIYWDKTIEIIDGEKYIHIPTNLCIRLGWVYTKPYVEFIVDSKKEILIVREKRLNLLDKLRLTLARWLCGSLLQNVW
jgi:hypothetical protein